MVTLQVLVQKFIIHIEIHKKVMESINEIKEINSEDVINSVKTDISNIKICISFEGMIPEQYRRTNHTLNHTHASDETVKTFTSIRTETNQPTCSVRYKRKTN